MEANEPTADQYVASLGDHPLTEIGLSSTARLRNGEEVTIAVTLNNFIYMGETDFDVDEEFEINPRGGYHAKIAQILRVALGHDKSAHYTISDGEKFVGEGCTVAQFLELHPDGSPPHVYMVRRRTLRELRQVFDSWHSNFRYFTVPPTYPDELQYYVFDSWHSNFRYFTVPPTYPDELQYYDQVYGAEMTCQLIKKVSFDWNPFDGLHVLGDSRIEETSFYEVNFNFLGLV
jgi:hypothetical protein